MSYTGHNADRWTDVATESYLCDDLLFSQSRGEKALKLLSGNNFHTSGPCDLDLWTIDPNNIPNLPLTEIYHPMKFKDSESKGTLVIAQKRNVTDGQDKNNMSPPTIEETY